MAADIAFALGALTPLGPRIPEALKVLRAALAIVDDLGALLVIAIFYIPSIEWRGVAVIAAFMPSIGFTMALFISGLAYAGTHFEREAQLAIMIGSLLAAAVGTAILLTSKTT